jgi:hypothetical protein
MNILLLSRNQDEDDLIKGLSLYGDVSCAWAVEDIPKRSYTIAVSYCFGPILSANDIAEIGCRIYNIHPSFLPYGRGIFPIMWAAALRNPFGATIHTIDTPKIDAGDIVIQRRLQLASHTTLAQAHHTLMALSRALFFESLSSGLLEKGLVTSPTHPMIPDLPTYKNRYESNQLYCLLPAGWNTSITETCKIYENLYRRDHRNS